MVGAALGGVGVGDKVDAAAVAVECGLRREQGVAGQGDVGDALDASVVDGWTDVAGVQVSGEGIGALFAECVLGPGQAVNYGADGVDGGVGGQGAVELGEGLLQEERVVEEPCGERGRGEEDGEGVGGDEGGGEGVDAGDKELGRLSGSAAARETAGTARQYARRRRRRRAPGWRCGRSQSRSRPGAA